MARKKFGIDARKKFNVDAIFKYIHGYGSQDKLPLRRFVARRISKRVSPHVL